jgi:hypothetical protein
VAENPTVPALVVQGAPGQSANLVEVRNAAGSVVASISPNGDLDVTGSVAFGASCVLSEPIAGQCTVGSEGPGCADAPPPAGVTTLVSQGQPQEVAVRCGTVYWSDASASTVSMVPATGGPGVVLASGQVYPLQLATDATYLYWGTNHGVNKVPLGGGALTTVVSYDSPYGIAVDASNVYFTNGGDGVFAAPLGGGAPTRLASGQALARLLAVNADHVYWTNDVPGGTIDGVPTTGGATVVLAGSQDYGNGIAVDADNVYWVTGNGNSPAGTVMKVPLGGGSPVTLASGYPNSQQVAVDANNVYWTVQRYNNQAIGAVLKVPINGGTPTTIWSASGAGPQGLALDATSVYWADPVAGTVMRAPK